MRAQLCIQQKTLACVLSDFPCAVSCSAQSQFISDYLQCFGLALGETHQLSLPWARQQLGGVGRVPKDTTKESSEDCFDEQQDKLQPLKIQERATAGLGFLQTVGFSRIKNRHTPYPQRSHVMSSDCSISLLIHTGFFGVYSTGKEVCYDRLGCFSDDAPWSGTVERPIYKLPWKPESIGTQFLLYTRQNKDYAQVRTVVV